VIHWPMVISRPKSYESSKWAYHSIFNRYTCLKMYSKKARADLRYGNLGPQILFLKFSLDFLNIFGQLSYPKSYPNCIKTISFFFSHLGEGPWNLELLGDPRKVNLALNKVFHGKYQNVSEPEVQ
jgi:hypothetical protein